MTGLFVVFLQISRGIQTEVFFIQAYLLIFKISTRLVNFVSCLKNVVNT